MTPDQFVVTYRVMGSVREGTQTFGVDYVELSPNASGPNLAVPTNENAPVTPNDILAETAHRDIREAIQFLRADIAPPDAVKTLRALLYVGAQKRPELFDLMDVQALMDCPQGRGEVVITQLRIHRPDLFEAKTGAQPPISRK